MTQNGTPFTPLCIAAREHELNLLFWRMILIKHEFPTSEGRIEYGSKFR